MVIFKIAHNIQLNALCPSPDAKTRIVYDSIMANFGVSYTIQ